MPQRVRCGVGAVEGAGFPIHPVTPDLFRGPPGGGGTARGSDAAPAGQWTPDQVRGDGVGVATLFLPRQGEVAPPKAVTEGEERVALRYYDVSVRPLRHAFGMPPPPGGGGLMAARIVG